jgi:hypothetical protein
VSKVKSLATDGSVVIKELDMDPVITSAVAALMGSTVGVFGSLASAWAGERSRNRRHFLQRGIAKRETTYAKFIDKASQLYAESASPPV